MQKPIRKQEQRDRNRLSAQAHRDRQKALLSQLTAQLAALQCENANLRAALAEAHPTPPNATKNQTNFDNCAPYAFQTNQQFEATPYFNRDQYAYCCTPQRTLGSTSSSVVQYAHPVSELPNPVTRPTIIDHHPSRFFTLPTHQNDDCHDAARTNAPPFDVPPFDVPSLELPPLDVPSASIDVPSGASKATIMWSALAWVAAVSLGLFGFTSSSSVVLGTSSDLIPLDSRVDQFMFPSFFPSLDVVDIDPWHDDDSSPTPKHFAVSIPAVTLIGTALNLDRSILNPHMRQVIEFVERSVAEAPSWLGAGGGELQLIVSQRDLRTVV